MIPLHDMDTLFDTREKRYRWIRAVLLAYWLWQCLWQCNFFVHLYQVDSYRSLFVFYQQLDAYTISVMVRLVYFFVFHGHLTFSFLDGACLIVTVWWLIEKHKGWLSAIGGYIAYVGIELVCCVHVGSVGELIGHFHRLSGLSLLVNGVFLLMILYRMIEMSMDIVTNAQKMD